jgi:putative colanic acid biosynthesis glycosyltransferase
MSPLISVIIVCRNPGPQLADAVSSVAAQGNHAELIVVDGASTDGTAGWLARSASGSTRYISEPDRGVYDAMNKGVALARGEWVLFLGADDRLVPDALRSAADALRTLSGDVACGEARFSDGRVYRFAGLRAAARRNFAHHQATFYRRSVFQRHGLYDTTLRMQADYDFNLRLMRARCAFDPLPVRIADCGIGGLSDSGAWQNYREEISVRHRHFAGLSPLLWDAVSVVRFLRKQIVRARRSR